MNILLLADHGETQLLSNDLLFQDKVERVLSFLKVKGYITNKKS